MRAGTRARIEEYGARRLQAPRVELLRASGLQRIAHPQPDAFFILALERSVVAAGPAELHDRLAGPRPEQLRERAALVALLPPGARCVGPAFVGYLDAVPVAPAAPSVEVRTPSRPRSASSSSQSRRAGAGARTLRRARRSTIW